MSKNANNYAYIDGQNLNVGIRDLGWKLDFKRFRVYLRDKYSVSRAYLFVGYIPENQDLYVALQRYGYIVKFKPVIISKDGQQKGNVDADMVLQILIDHFEKVCDHAILVTSDGDFYSVVQFLQDKKALERVLSPHYKTCSTLLKRTAREKISFMDNLRNKLEYKKKNTA